VHSGFNGVNMGKTYAALDNNEFAKFYGSVKVLIDVLQTSSVYGPKYSLKPPMRVLAM